MKIQSHALLIGFVAVSFLALLHLAAQAQAERPVEQWGIFEISLKGPTAGNPFKNVTLDAIFAQGKETVKVKGFYDGGGTYRIRFMPEKTGTWSYKTKSNIPQLNGKTGAFDAVKPSTGNRGPVRVRNTFHFGYADGTPYFQIGTTSYAWTHQGDELEEQTLATLKVSPFNKMRMCIFPKHYAYNANEPIFYPFPINPDGKFDLERFDPAFFRHLEKRVGDLRDLGIEADLILFHPYDRWGFSVMEKETDDRYLRYVIARLSAYRNVWWSLANEYDFMNAGRNELADLRKRGLSIRVKQSRDWDRFFEILQNEDPHKHLRSIHNGFKLYNHTKPWATHASIQNGSAVTDPGRAIILRDAYEKPIVYDEVKYEGNISQRWGNISAEEMAYRFWQGTIAGTYVGHSETYMHPKDIIWWSKGGVLHGQSPPRIAFLRKVLEDGPPEGMEPIDKWQDKMIAGKKGEYYLIYFGKKLGKYSQQKLADRGVEIHLNTKVSEVDGSRVTLSDGTEIVTNTLIWTAGTAPNPLLEALPCNKDRGKVCANEYMEVAGYEGVWAVGDSAAIVDPKTGRLYPPTAQHAIRQGTVLAHNIRASIRGGKMKPFVFETIGQLAAIGRRTGVAQILGINFSGFIAWWLWRTIYLMKLPRFEKKLRVALDWTLDLMFTKDPVQFLTLRAPTVSSEELPVPPRNYTATAR